MDAPSAAVLDHVRAVAAQVADEIHAMQREAQASAHSKGGVDVVTVADTHAERLITAALAAAYPQHRIAGEEGTRVGPPDSPWCWHIDPLDGTCNYSRGLPYWMVSIGLAHGDTPVLGALAGPACGLRLAGGRGLGAWADDRRLEPLAPAGEERSWLVATDWPWDLPQRSRVIGLLQGLAPRIRQFKTYGSAAVDLAHVALGRVDAYAIPRIFPWDQCGGAAICAELGCELKRWDGSPWDLRHNDIICQRPGMALERFTAGGP